jgi:hypothetical protein
MLSRAGREKGVQYSGQDPYALAAILLSLAAVSRCGQKPYRDGSTVSCAFAPLQLRQAFSRSLHQERRTASGFERSHQGGSEDLNRGTGQENNSSQCHFPLDFRFQQSNACGNGHRATRLAPLPRQRPPASAGLRWWRRAVAPISWGGALICPRASLRDQSSCVLRAKPARVRRLGISPGERIPSRHGCWGC